MGAVLSCVREATSLDMPAEHWDDWSKHPGLQPYQIKEELARAPYCQALLAKKTSTRERVALRVIYESHPSISRAACDALLSEAELVQTLSHPSIVGVRALRAWHQPKMVVVEEELLQGPELMDGVAMLASHSDACDKATLLVWKRKVLQQLFSALAYLHGQGILHRGIHPEAIRFAQRLDDDGPVDDGKLAIKLTGFSMACRVGRSELAGRVGSPGGMAPEVIRGLAHAPAMDVFSAGVVACLVLTHALPMAPEAAVSLGYAHDDAWEHARLQPGNAAWDGLPREGRDLLLRLLEWDPSKRLTAAQALEHPWFTGEELEPSAAHSRLREQEAASARLRVEGAGCGGGGKPIKGLAGPAASQPPSTAAEADHWGALLRALWKMDSKLKSLGRGSIGSIQPGSPAWRHLVLRAYVHGAAFRSCRAVGRVGLPALPPPSRTLLEWFVRVLDAAAPLPRRPSRALFLPSLPSSNGRTQGGSSPRSDTSAASAGGIPAARNGCGGPPEGSHHGRGGRLIAAHAALDVQVKACVVPAEAHGPRPVSRGVLKDRACDILPLAPESSVASAVGGDAATEAVIRRLQCYNELQSLDEAHVCSTREERANMRKLEVQLAVLLFTSGD